MKDSFQKKDDMFIMYQKIKQDLDDKIESARIDLSIYMQRLEALEYEWEARGADLLEQTNENYRD